MIARMQAGPHGGTGAIVAALPQPDLSRPAREPIMPDVDGQAYDALLALLEADPCVRLVYAFGSAARGEAGSLSDVDIAVLLERRPTWDTERELRSRLARAVPRVDVVILNEAPPALRYEIVTGGRLLLARDAREQAEFEILSLSRFLDFQPVRRVQQAYLRARVESRRGAPA
jgi:predicted nucleotidyltransferase